MLIIFSLKASLVTKEIYGIYRREICKRIFSIDILYFPNHQISLKKRENALFRSVYGVIYNHAHPLLSSSKSWRSKLIFIQKEKKIEMTTDNRGGGLPLETRHHQAGTQQLAD
jgi:hypothetical protein